MLTKKQIKVSIPLQSMTNWRSRIKETNEDQRRAESTTKTAAQTDSNINPVPSDASSLRLTISSWYVVRLSARPYLPY